MLFNSLTFLIFLIIIFVLYWFVLHKNLRLQNFFLVLFSYIFYGWWDWRFTILMAFTSLWAYGSGIVLDIPQVIENKAHRRWVIFWALLVNLGILGIFKYYNFFISQAIASLGLFGITLQPLSLKVILPVGISFYTFQALSYVLDVSRRNIRATKDPIAFLAFVSFFPQLVAGPIERATDLLPQFLQRRTFSYPKAVDGCRQMLWGFFKKMVIADGCALLPNYIIQTGAEANWVIIWLMAFLFTFQIYGDFSGYSDIAIGCSKLFGIELKRNFNFPYFARNIAEFWRRWHISLTTWFRDYLYIPLGGSKCTRWKQVRNTFVIFLVSGLWHGANWTFVLWGFVHACCFLPLLLFGNNRKYLDVAAVDRVFPTWSELWRMVLTFFVVLLGWVIFLAPNLSTMTQWLSTMFTFSTFKMSLLKGYGLHDRVVLVMPWIVFMLVVEWYNRSQLYGCARYPRAIGLRWLCYLGLTLGIVFFHFPKAGFIYFQF